MKSFRPIVLWITLAFVVPAIASEEEVYQLPEDFLDESFDGKIPAPALLWLTQSMRDDARQILGYDYSALRVRYWAEAHRSAWILDAIGKVKPITVGIVVADGEIERLKVLVYRESHGWEVRHPFFTDRFQGAGLTGETNQLDRPIDNIAGATLSVNALKRLAALALLFDCAVQVNRGP